MTHDEMLDVMPHRGRNVLIDDYEDEGGNGGRATLCIAPGDALGRDLFLVREGGGLRYSAFFLVEHMALNSIMVLREEMGGGCLAYFSVVTKFVSLGTAEAGTPLVSHVTRAKDRREFRAFRAGMETVDGRPLLEANFMAYLAARGERPGPDTQAKTPAPKGLRENNFAGQRALMRPSGKARGRARCARPARREGEPTPSGWRTRATQQGGMQQPSNPVVILAQTLRASAAPRRSASPASTRPSSSAAIATRKGGAAASTRRTIPSARATFPARR